MGEVEVDIFLLLQRCGPGATGPKTRRVRKSVGGVSSGLTISDADYASLTTSATTSFLSFDADASTRLGTWYTTMTTDRRNTCWTAFADVTP